MSVRSRLLGRADGLRTVAAGAPTWWCHHRNRNRKIGAGDAFPIASQSARSSFATATASAPVAGSFRISVAPMMEWTDQHYR
jgi:hypothetical protein